MIRDSYWGIQRKVFGDYLQANFKDRLKQWELNLNPATCDADDIANWERQLGIPVNPSKTLAARRAFVQSRRQRGPFTRTRRAKLIEAFIIAVFGEAASFGTDGISFGTDGIPLLADATSVEGTYEVVEDIPGFSYDVRVLDSVTVDNDGLSRELERVTPAPMTFSISTVTEI